MQRTIPLIVILATCSLAPAADQVIGSTTTDRLPQAGNWQYNLCLDGKDHTSIGFHDSMHSVSSIRYTGSKGFTIGGDDGWGVKPVTLAGDAIVGSNLELAGTNRWVLHTPDDGRQDLCIGKWVNGAWTWPMSISDKGNWWTAGAVSATGAVWSNVGFGTKGYVWADGDVGAKGNVNAHGYLWTNGAVYANGDVNGYSNINAARNVNANGYIWTAGAVNCWGNVNCESDVNAKHNVNASGYVWSAAGLNTNGSIFATGNAQINGTLRSGAISTADLVVKQAWWGDFVFADDYQLMPLPELKQYIQANKHLPGIPDQATIVKDGVQVNEMLALHMVKIEEQTRHLIEQHETIVRLEKTIADQQKSIDAMLARLNRVEAAAGVAPGQDRIGPQ